MRIIKIPTLKFEFRISKFDRQNRKFKMELFIFLFCMQTVIVHAQDIVISSPPPAPTNTNSNYLPSTDFPSHTPLKIIKVNFHYFINEEVRNPMSFTETTGCNPQDTVNNGYTNAHELIDQVNYQLSHNLQLNLPCNNSIPVLPTDLRFEIYTDPNKPEDKGIYFHHFNDVFTNGKPNLNSKFWYQYYQWNPNTTKQLFTVHGEKVIDLFFLESTNKDDGGGVASGNPTATSAAVNVADIFELASGMVEYKLLRQATNAATIIHEVSHILSLQHVFPNDDCDDTPMSTPAQGGCYKDSTCNLFTNNVMDYCGGYRGFSPCQIAKINQFVEESFPAYVQCFYDTTQTIVIHPGENITWDGVKHLNGDLIIESGGKLTVNANLFMPTHAQIIVQAKGTLVLHHCVINKSCDEAWKGILLGRWYDVKRKKQYTGKVILQEGSRLENALQKISYWRMKTVK